MEDPLGDNASKHILCLNSQSILLVLEICPSDFFSNFLSNIIHLIRLLKRGIELLNAVITK